MQDIDVAGVDPWQKTHWPWADIDVLVNWWKIDAANITPPSFAQRMHEKPIAE